GDDGDLLLRPRLLTRARRGVLGGRAGRRGGRRPGRGGGLRGRSGGRLRGSLGPGGLLPDQRLKLAALLVDFAPLLLDLLRLLLDLPPQVLYLLAQIVLRRPRARYNHAPGQNGRGKEERPICHRFSPGWFFR